MDPNPYEAPKEVDYERSRLAASKVGNRAAELVDRADYPLWVKFSLLGVPSRAGQWFFCVLSIAFAMGCVAYANWGADPRFYAGAGLLFSALWYWLTIRWVDRNGSWP